MRVSLESGPPPLLGLFANRGNDDDDTTQGFDERESSIKDRNSRQRESKGEGRNSGGYKKKARAGALPTKPRPKKGPATTTTSSGKKRSSQLAIG